MHSSAPAFVDIGAWVLLLTGAQVVGCGATSTATSAARAEPSRERVAATEPAIRLQRSEVLTDATTAATRGPNEPRPDPSDAPAEEQDAVSAPGGGPGSERCSAPQEGEADVNPADAGLEGGSAPDEGQGDAGSANSSSPSPHDALRVDVEGDRPVVVYMAPPEVERAIVYLHGHCGRLSKIEEWAPDATRFGTVIALLGNWECRGAPGRFRWGMSTRYLDTRITRAVERVKEIRGGALDTERITVIGYSQGAEKAELLPRWHPERYPRIVLAGPPAAPHPWLLAPAEAVVVIAGENENQHHIRRGFRDLQYAGNLAAFMELPEAAHGDFGPEGATVMGQALWWLFDRAP